MWHITSRWPTADEVEVPRREAGLTPAHSTACWRNIEQISGCLPGVAPLQAPEQSRSATSGTSMA
ncbi:MAG: hypothetical protein AAGF95_13325 [Chloroflexota bacterium]